MAGVTPNIRLNLPTYDQPGWDTLVNANLQILDSLVARGISITGIYLGIYTAGNSYVLNNVVTDPADSKLWQANSGFTTSVSLTFAQERAANPSHWTDVTTSTNNAATSATVAAGSATAAAASATTAQTAGSQATDAATLAVSGATTAVNAALSQVSMFRNKLINSQQLIQQMTAVGVNVGGTSANAYINDGWICQSSGVPSLLAQTKALVDGDRTLIGDYAARYGIQAVSSGAAGVNDYARVVQRIEGVSQLAGTYVVVSMWMAAPVGMKICISFDQNFGTGGAPSTTVTGIGQQVFTGTGAWTKYTSSPMLIPTTVGKTIGSTANTDYTQMNLWQSAGATIGAAQAGSIGSQAFVNFMYGIQLEIGAGASALERRPMSIELALCQRYYEIGNVVYSGWCGAASQAIAYSVPFKVTKRLATQTIAKVDGSVSNITSTTSGAIGADAFQLISTATSSGVNSIYNGTWSADCRL